MKKRDIFKIAQKEEIGGTGLSLDGVYRVSIAKADYGKSIELWDIRTMRMLSPKVFQFTAGLRIPRGVARRIKVYKIK